jgi:hypothetical protein
VDRARQFRIRACFGMGVALRDSDATRIVDEARQILS